MVAMIRNLRLKSGEVSSLSGKSGISEQREQFFERQITILDQVQKINLDVILKLEELVEAKKRGKRVEMELITKGFDLVKKERKRFIFENLILNENMLWTKYVEYSNEKSANLLNIIKQREHEMQKDGSTSRSISNTIPLPSVPEAISKEEFEQALASSAATSISGKTQERTSTRKSRPISEFSLLKSTTFDSFHHTTSVPMISVSPSTDQIANKSTVSKNDSLSPLPTIVTHTPVNTIYSRKRRTSLF